MKKYIDADLLKSELKDLNESERLYYMGVFDIINSQPAADVEEVRHGKWINDGDCFHCSVCNKSFGFLSEKCVSNFCPNCGAKMEQLKLL